MHNQGIKVPNISGKKPGRKWPLWMGLGCGGFLLALLLIGVFLLWTLWTGISFWRYAENWDKKDEPWAECALDVPDSAVRVVFLRQKAHPFLAEYDRKLRIEVSGKPDVVLDLPPNTGGQTMINIYYNSETAEDGTRIETLMLVERRGSYLVDLANRNIMEKEGSVVPGDDYEYIGRLDGRGGSLRFVPPNESPEEEINDIQA